MQVESRNLYLGRTVTRISIELLSSSFRPDKPASRKIATFIFKENRSVVPMEHGQIDLGEGEDDEANDGQTKDGGDVKPNGKKANGKNAAMKLVGSGEVADRGNHVVVI